MGVLYNQASFKNSRVSSRKPTTTNDTFELTVLAASNTVISIANPNRTYLTVRNLSTTNDMKYDYFNNPSILTEGFTLKANEAVDLEGPLVVYGRAIGVDVIVDCDEGSG